MKNMSKSMALDVLRDLLCAAAGELTFQVRQSFSFQAGPWWHIQGRVKEDLFLAYVVSGQGRYVTDRAAFDMAPGRVFWIGNGVRHSAIIDEAQPPVLLTIHFQAVSHRDGTPCPLSQPLLITAQPAPSCGMQQVFAHVYDTVQRPQPWIAALCHGYVLHILSSLYQTLAEHPLQGTPIPHELQAAETFLRQHAYRQVSIRALAGQAGYSEKYFSALFRRYYHVSPKQYHTQLRMQAASCFLQETGMTVAEIAQALGYADAFSFSKQFRRFTGLSPRTVRGQGMGPWKG